MEEVNLAHYYEGYPLNDVSLVFPIRTLYRNRLKRLKRAGLRPAHRVLDYGCGGGLFVQYLKSHGFLNTVGYDAFVPRHASPGALQMAHYDYVVSYDVIEHVEDPRKFMVELTGLLRPGGHLTIGTPRAEGVNLQRRHDLVLHPPYHRHILSENVLLLLGRQNGLAPADVYRKSLFDSLIPTVNWRFIAEYVEQNDGLFDAAIEPPRPWMVLTSPRLLGLAFLGSFVPRGDNMVISFRKE